MSIKILVISDYRSFHTVRPEAEIFIGLAKKGFDITIMTYGDAVYKPAFLEAGIRVIDFHPQKKFDREEIAFIRNELQKNKYQVLYLFNSMAIYNGIRAAKNLPVKVVLYRGYTGNIRWYDPASYLKYLHPRVDKIVCNSIGVEQLINRQLLFRSKSKTITINKGHVAEWYTNVEQLNKSDLNLPDDAFVAVLVANDRRMKGIPYLLKSSYYLPSELPIHYVLVGKGLDKPAYQKIADRSPNREKIHFLGFRKDALSIVKMSDTFVLSSIKGESITKSVIEAMALETTPVITDIPGNVELVEDGVSGLVVPSKNARALARAIERLYQNPEQNALMAKAANKRLSTHLNHYDTVEKMKTFFEQLVASDD